MKRLFLSLLFIPTLLANLYAEKSDYNDIPYSSYTDVGTPGPMMFSSTTVQFVGITISSPSSVEGYVSIFRSTSAAFTPEIATQTFINTSYATAIGQPTYIPLHEMKNSSYTYMSKVGNAKITFWLRCPPNPKGNRDGAGFCPGLPWDGDVNTRIELK